MNAQTMTPDVREMITARITCRCKLLRDVRVATLSIHAWMLADEHERENVRRAYRHDVNVEEIAR